ncbi:MAG: PAS domain-containing sensor histidine kinase [Planctomycetota bacterium]
MTVEENRLRQSSIQRVASTAVIMLSVIGLDFLCDAGLSVFYIALISTAFILLNLVVLIFPLPANLPINIVSRVLHLLLITFFIHTMGGIRAHGFVAAYALAIVYAAVFYSRGAAIAATLMAMGMYLGLIFLQYRGLIPDAGSHLGGALPSRTYFMFFGALNTLVILYAGVTAIMILETLRNKNSTIGDFSATMERNIRQQSGHLNRTQTQLDRLVHSIREFAILTISLDGNIRSFHEGPKGIFGWQPSEITGAAIDRLQPNTGGAAVQRLIERARKTFNEQPGVDQLSDTRVTLVRRTGEEFCGEITISRMTAMEDEPPGFILVIHDTTAREGLNHRLQEAEVRYKGFLEALRDSLVTIDHGGNFTWANQYFLDLSGYTMAELLGGTKPDAVFVFSEQGETHFKDHSSWAADVFLVHKSGKRIPIALTLSTIREAGREAGSVGLIKDLTAVRESTRSLESYTHQLLESRSELEKLNTKLMEQQKDLRHSKAELEKLNKVKNAFIANLSQELKTPLIAGMGYIDLVLNGDTGPVGGDVQNYLQISHRNLKKLGLMIDNLLSISRLAESEHAADLVPVNLADRLPVWLKDELADKTVEFVLNIPVPVAVVQADDFLLSRVFSNLVFFSKAHAPDRAPSVGITAAARPDRILEVRYHDRRLYLPPRAVETVFAGLLERTEEDAARGGVMGVGLSIVKNIIDMHGGTIQAASSPNDGTLFIFTLKRNM